MWREILSWNRKEQYGVLSLCFILLCLSLLLFVETEGSTSEVDPQLQAWVDSVLQRTDSLKENIKVQADHFFRFNPNSASAEQLKKLGFSSYAISNLIKYRESGGYINNFAKLSTIYGMDSSHLEKIKSYLLIPNQNKQEASKRLFGRHAQQSFFVDLNTVNSKQLLRWGVEKAVVDDIENVKQKFFITKRLNLEEVKRWTFKEWAGLKDSLLVVKHSSSVLNDDFEIELNSADTSELVLLKGIGRVFAYRIVKYRRRLGGFYNLSQLQEVDGISPVVVDDNRNHIIIDTSLVDKVDVNKASLRRMKDHPYCNFYMAKDIYEARKRGEVKLDDVLGNQSFKGIDKSLLRQYFVD